MRLSLRDAQVAGALLTVWLLWGSSFLAIRVVVLSAPPLLSAGVRFAAAGLLLLTGVACWRRLSGAPSARLALAGRLGRLSVLGMLQFLLANGLVSIAAQDLPSSTTAVLYSTVPLWSLFLVSVVDRVRPSGVDLATTALGVLGVAVVLGLHTSAGVVPAVLVLAAAASWATATLLAAREPRGDTASPRPGPALECSVQMLAGGATLLVAAAVAGELSTLSVGAVEAQAWIAEAHLVLFGSLAGFSAYTWMVSSGVDARLTGTFAYVCPVVAVILGALVLDEHVGLNTVAGTGLVVTSVALTVRATTKSRPVTPPPVPAERVPSAGPYAEQLARRGG